MGFVPPHQKTRTQTPRAPGHFKGLTAMKANRHSRRSRQQQEGYVRKLLKGVKRFQEEVFPEREGLFQELACGQSPRILFITCADSRIDPNLITQAEPGELFICRNAGNIVPPHMDTTGGMTASIEYAVAALGVRHIVICGHSDCGAMKAALQPESLVDFPHVKDWLGHTSSAVRVLKEKYPGKSNSQLLDPLIQENVLQQMMHIRTHPYVAAKLATNKIKLHGWVYDIKTGSVFAHNPANGIFEDVRVDLPDEIASRLAHDHSHDGGHDTVDPAMPQGSHTFAAE